MSQKSEAIAQVIFFSTIRAKKKERKKTKGWVPRLGQDEERERSNFSSEMEVAKFSAPLML